MATITKISKWGNSNGIRIPLKYMKKLHLQDDQNVKVYVKGNKLITEAIDQHPHDIHELFKDYQGPKLHGHEMNWGKSKGHEVW